MTTDLLFSHADIQPYTSTLPRHEQQRRDRYAKKKPEPVAKATADNVAENGPENPIVHAMTHRIDGALIGKVYRMCREHNTGFDEIVTQALTEYVNAKA